jgi:hypothetical protein
VGSWESGVKSFVDFSTSLDIEYYLNIEFFFIFRLICLSKATENVKFNVIEFVCY